MSQVRENNVTYTTTQYATSQIPSRTVTNTYTTGGYTTGGQYASNLVGGQYSSNVVGGQSYYATTGPQYSTTDKLVNQTYQTTTKSLLKRSQSKAESNTFHSKRNTLNMIKSKESKESHMKEKSSNTKK